MRFNKKGGSISTDDLKNIKITLALDPLPATNCPPPPPTSGAPGPNIVDKIGPVMPGFPALTPEQIKQALAMGSGFFKTFLKPEVMDPLGVKKDLQHGMHNVPGIEFKKKIEDFKSNVKDSSKTINDLQEAVTDASEVANGKPPVKAGGRKKRTRRKIRKRRAKTLRRKRYTKKRRKLRRRKSRRRRR